MATKTLAWEHLPNGKKRKRTKRRTVKPVPCPLCPHEPAVALDMRSAFVQCVAFNKSRMKEHELMVRGRTTSEAIKRWNKAFGAKT